MTKQEFLNAVSNGGDAVLKQILQFLKETHAEYCVIGGLAVNGYVEPVVSLDLDIVIVASSIDAFLELAKKTFKIERFPHSINLKSKQSDLRIQVQTDSCYQDFLAHSLRKKVLGYQMKVAALEDVLKGKIWAYSDKQRRKSKRLKDLSDIYRLVERYPHLKIMLPKSLRA